MKIIKNIEQLEREITHVNANLLSQVEIAENAEAKAKSASLRLMVDQKRLLG